MNQRMRHNFCIYIKSVNVLYNVKCQNQVTWIWNDVKIVYMFLYIYIIYFF